MPKISFLVMGYYVTICYLVNFDDITLSNILLTGVVNAMQIHLSGSDVVDDGIPQSIYDL